MSQKSISTFLLDYCCKNKVILIFFEYQIGLFLFFFKSFSKILLFYFSLTFVQVTTFLFLWMLSVCFCCCKGLCGFRKQTVAYLVALSVAVLLRFLRFRQPNERQMLAAAPDRVEVCVKPHCFLKRELKKILWDLKKQLYFVWLACARTSFR